MSSLKYCFENIYEKYIFWYPRRVIFHFNMILVIFKYLALIAFKGCIMTADFMSGAIIDYSRCINNVLI